MTKYIVIFCLICTTAFGSSNIVRAKGYGSSEIEALDDAKKNAIEMAVGSWINSTNTANQDKFSSNTSAFTTGTIESFKIIENGQGFVIIEARIVDRKDNTVKAASTFVSAAEKEQLRQIIENNKHILSSISAIDDINLAMVFIIDKTTVETNATLAGFDRGILRFDGVLEFNNKWKNDYKEFKNKTNEPLFVDNCGKIGFEMNLFDKDGKEIAKSSHITYLNINYKSGSEINLQFKEDFFVAGNFSMSEIDNFQKAEIKLYCRNKERNIKPL